MWYLMFGKQSPPSKNRPTHSRVIGTFKRRRDAEEACLSFVDTLKRRYEMIYEWVEVTPISRGYAVDHSKQNGTRSWITDYIFVDDCV